MSLVKGLTLRILRGTKIAGALEGLFTGSLGVVNKKNLLEIGILLFNSDDKFVSELGYRILLKLSLQTRNFLPLYDIAAVRGYTPIVELLRSQDLMQPNEKFFDEFLASYRKGFADGEVFQTEEQKALFDSFIGTIDETVAVVAPTSYGKSELIEVLVKNSKLNIAVVVPSKALVAQTRRRITLALGEDSDAQVVVHHDSTFDPSQQIVAVVTQERLLRIFQKYPDVKFSKLIIDEAHNLLSSDKRSRLLASVIIIAKSREPNLATKYLTPFLMSSENLRCVGNSDEPITEIRVEERLKSEDYKVCDLTAGGAVSIYDQFLDHFYANKTCENFNDVFELLRYFKKSKNIVYLNRPKHIEEVASKLMRGLARKASDELEKTCKEIAEYVHPQYKLLDCLKVGVAYHHGSVPDSVRAYVENSFRKLSELQWVITSSTLLEGVNVPAQMLFVLDPRKGLASLTAAQFRNLVGRVNRFSEIFSQENGSPELLCPEVIVAKCQFSRVDLNVEKFISRVAKIDRKINDEVENPILERTSLDEEGERKRREDFIIIENIEPGFSFLPQRTLAKTEFGRLCFIHNIYEIDILNIEDKIQRIVEATGNAKISSAEDLMNEIARIFILNIRDDYESGGQRGNLERLRNLEARKFYAMFFDWRIDQSNYRKMIASFVAYWKRKLASGEDPVAYAGKWGDVPRDQENTTNYVNLSRLSDYEMINLAIVRIKEEQDFIDNNLVKYLEVLNDLKLVDDSLYKKVKYGTDDEMRIALIRNGLSHIAAHVLVEKYRDEILVDEGDRIRISKDIKQRFKVKNEKEIVIFEVESSGLIRD